MIAWFRTRKQLRTRNAELEALVAKQTEEIATLRADMKHADDVAIEGNRRMAASYWAHIDEMKAQLQSREQRLAEVVDELKAFREEIRQAEESGNLRSATGPGMARVANRPLPWQVVDAINQEAAAKRHEDGLGDPE